MKRSNSRFLVFVLCAGVSCSTLNRRVLWFKSLLRLAANNGFLSGSFLSASDPSLCVRCLLCNFQSDAAFARFSNFLMLSGSSASFFSFGDTSWLTIPFFSTFSLVLESADSRISSGLSRDFSSFC